MCVMCRCLCVCVCVTKRAGGKDSVRENKRERESIVGLVAGKKLLERGKEVPYDRNTPRASKQPLPSQTTHVRHVGIVDGKTKYPEKRHGNK